MAHITTSCGFEADIDEELLNDYEFLEVMREAEKSPLAFADIVVFLLGKDGKEGLKACLREVYGRARPENVRDAVMEILAQLSESKKK